jgi:hypothetical protein
MEHTNNIITDSKKRVLILFSIALMLFLLLIFNLFGFEKTICIVLFFVAVIVFFRKLSDADYSKPIEYIPHTVRDKKPIDPYEKYYIDVIDEVQKETFVPTVGFLPHNISESDFQDKYKAFQHCYEKEKNGFKKFEEGDNFYFEEDLKAKYKLMDKYKEMAEKK